MTQPERNYQQPSSAGVLAQLWVRGEYLPRLSPWEQTVCFLRRGIGTVTALPFTNALAIGTTAVALYLLGIFLIVTESVERILNVSGGESSAVAFLRGDATEEDIAVLRQTVSGIAGVVQVRYVSRDEALRSFQAELGGRFLASLQGVNPLPASIEVTFEGNDRATGDRLEQTLGHHTLVDEFVSAGDWGERFRSAVELLRVGALLLCLLIFLGALFVIFNTMRLVLYARRQEVEIMKLVGASDTFIRLPFLVGGALQGLLAGGIALVCLTLSHFLLNMKLRAMAVFDVEPLVFFSPLQVIVFLFLGLGLSALASRFAVGRFLDV